MSLLITPTTDFSFPGTTDEENTIVSHFTISREGCFPSAILVRAENSSP
jgi:hypothetical protein|tara:strand:- start:136 stop:282 length:147 start_codon:yes stop_codon:yes gene_type:complete